MCPQYLPQAQICNQQNCTEWQIKIVNFEAMLLRYYCMDSVSVSDTYPKPIWFQYNYNTYPICQLAYRLTWILNPSILSPIRFDSSGYIRSGHHSDTSGYGLSTVHCAWFTNHHTPWGHCSLCTAPKTSFSSAPRKNWTEIFAESVKGLHHYTTSHLIL